MMIMLGLFGFFGTSAFAQIASVTPATRCGEGAVTLQATASSGTVTWYDVPFYGTAIATGNSFTTPDLSDTKTYYVDAVDASGCSLNTDDRRITVIATVSAGSIQASIFYESNAFCKSVVGEQLVTRTGTAGGIYTVDPSGLTINATTGAITPSSSTNGFYTVTYTIETPSAGCIEEPATTTVTITDAPLESSISYAGTPYCSTSTSATVTLINPNDGTFSASPAGLSINASTGEIDPSNSLSGGYTVTYFVSGAGGCAPQTKTTDVTITGLPTAAISYTNTPFCMDITDSQSPVLTGTGAYTGGTYSYTGTELGSFNSSTGAFIPSTSAAGSYTITYTTPASGNCAEVEANTSITINPLPAAEISGTTSICQNATAPIVTFTGSLGTAPYTFIYKVNGGGDKTVSSIDEATTATVAQATSEAGIYAYTLVSVTDANGCSQAASGTATITVTGTPVATFVYAGSPYCKVGTASPLFIGEGIAGTFSGTNVVFISTATGEIDLVNTPAGDYTITNTISSCGGISETADITINALPTAGITGTLTACGSTTLTATSNASSPSYVWYNGDDVIEGQTAVTLVVDASGNYKVKVTDGETNCEFTSDASSVDIYPMPTASIDGSLTACGSTTLTAVTDATTPSYVWYKDNVAIDGETASTLDVTESGDYKVDVTSENSCTTTSIALPVTVSSSPVAGDVTGGQTVCTGSNSTLLTASGYTGNILRWESSLDGSEWALIEMSTVEATYTATGLTVTTLYRTVIGSGSCAEVYSTTTTITVVPDPTLSQPDNASICLGGTTTLTTTASGGTGTYAYQWQYATASDGTYADVVNATPTGITYAGATSTDLVITGDGSETAQANYYKCVLTTLTPTGAGCDAETTAITVTSTLDPSWGTTTTPAASITYGSSVTFSATVENGLGGAITWIRSTTSGGEGTTVTSPDTPPAAGTYYYRPHYEPTGSGCNLSDGTETTVVVGQKELTVTGLTGDNKVYDGNTNATATGTAELSGIVGADVVTLGGTPVYAFASANVATGISISTTGFTLGGANAGNYTLTQPTLSGTIYPPAPTGSSSQTFCSGN